MMFVVLKLCCTLVSPGELVKCTGVQALPLNQNVPGGACLIQCCRPKANYPRLTLLIQSQSWSSQGRLRSLIFKVRWCVGAAKCPQLLLGFLRAPPLCPFLLLFYLHILPCVPSPGLDFCPVSSMMLSERDFKPACLIMSRHTSKHLGDLSLHLSVAQQVLHSLAPLCLLSQSHVTLFCTQCQ